MRPSPDSEFQRLTPKRWTPEEYDALCRAGILGEDTRLELLEGVIVEMTPPGPAHTGLTGRLTTLLAAAAQGRAVVHSQSPMALGEHRPQPDIAVVPLSEDSLTRLPTQALLVVEVADTSLSEDRLKASIYALAGIPEFWLVNVADRAVEVHTEPDVESGRYRTIHVRMERDSLTTPCLPGVRVAVSDLFAGLH